MYPNFLFKVYKCMFDFGIFILFKLNVNHGFLSCCLNYFNWGTTIHEIVATFLNCHCHMLNEMHFSDFHINSYTGTLYLQIIMMKFHDFVSE